MKLITKHSLIWVIIISIFFSSLSMNVSSYKEYNTTDIEDLAFKEELYISIDTSLNEARFQPIDIRVDFDHPCWAKNETVHSVRVGFDDGSGLIEIESQIYDLEYSDDTHINSCSLVFLIPEKANGKETYYVLYDSSETDAPDYEDHIILEDTHYFYEPISGQVIDFDYYGIIEEGYVIYAVTQKGDLLGNPAAHAVAKFKPGATEVETNTVDQYAVFDMRYGAEGIPDFVGSAEAAEVNKKTLVDGNLMVRARIESISLRGDIKTDNIYTYYYCPTETKRLFINVNHEVLKKVNIDEPSVLDGTYAGIVTIKSRSKSIEKMNVGNILPSLNLYDEDETIKEYYVPPDPESIAKELVLSTEDDIDLGSKGWVCLNDPATGKAHGLIMHSNIGLVDGIEDGVQVKAYVQQNIKLPGLEADTGSVYLGRNSYEKGGSHNTVLTQGFNVNFDVEFISDEKGRYERIDSESEIFQTLVKTIPILRENVTDGEEDDEERFFLTTFVHLAPSAPLGSLLSAVLGKNIPYIYAELYKEDSFKSSGSVGRLPLSAIELDLEGKNLFQKLKTVIGLFDWRNASFFKKICFPDLEAGTYIIKVFKENPFFAKERQYIGFTIVELKNDDKVHINCRLQGSIRLSIFDQKEKGVKNVRFLLETEDVTIAETVSDKNGTAILKAPCYPLKPYTLKAIYQGFLVEEKKITLGLRNRFIQLKDSFSIEHYKLNLKLKDTWGFAPAVEVNPTLRSSEMIDQVHISAEKSRDGEYIFTNLYPAKYTLNMRYKSFEVEKDVSIDKDKSLDLMFPAEYELDFNIMNSYGDLLSKGEISVSRNRKVERKSIDESGRAKISVPPNKYEITVYSEGEKLAWQEIDVRGNKEIDIVTSQESVLHIVVIYLGIALTVFSIIFMLWKKKMYKGINLFVIALLIIALVSPWWVLNGDDGITATTTKTLLFPPKIVTLSSSSAVLGGDVSQVPPEVTMVLSLLSVLLAVSCLIIFITIFTKNKLRKTTAFLSILSIVILIATLSIFFYAMSQLTEVGVGSFIDGGDVETSLPGLSESKILPCKWGPGIGFYLGLIAAIILVVVLFYYMIKTRCSKR